MNDWVIVALGAAFIVTTVLGAMLIIRWIILPPKKSD